MTAQEISTLVESQRKFFATGTTLPVKFRKAMLKKLYATVVKYQTEIQQMIMNEARRIADELIIVTQVNMDEQLKQAGFEIVERCEAVKGKFVRYITMCR